MRAHLPTFWIKAALLAGLVALADQLLFTAPDLGGNMGMVLLGFVAAAGLAHRAIWKSRVGLTALGSAAALALVQIEHATIVGWLMFWTALAVAVLAPRAAASDGAWQWWQRLVVLGLKGLIAPVADLLRLLKTRERRGRIRPQAVLLTLALPAIGGVVFFALFAAANPVIGDWFSALSLPTPDFERIIPSAFVALLAWGALRPHSLRRPLRTVDAQGELDLPGVTLRSITLSLVVFNAIFALQNGLDVAFLWSGAPLPEGMTLAEYAHRGAYPLIATALLAGVFVVVFLRPGTATADAPLVRRLVILWIVQNLFLVASTALRTIDYIDVYSLTRLRIAALLWMGLVATGLGLIAWRLLKAKSTAWLINANVLGAGVVLAGCAVVDLGAVAAAWNVRHAREAGGRGEALDVCYLQGLGGGAAVSLAQLERMDVDPELKARAAWARAQAVGKLEENHADWRTWTFRDARRLSRVQALTQGLPPPRPTPCRPAAPRLTAPQLTAPANPR
ncbi:DUF4173 domain-containing protein [Phenylobacterium sp.]|uniref:DUF4153 domain-containing protein n=1 Tax=Phenylobacterium sp. TaxID=1871053 RepID=UPI002F95E604